MIQKQTQEENWTLGIENRKVLTLNDMGWTLFGETVSIAMHVSPATADFERPLGFCGAPGTNSSWTELTFLSLGVVQKLESHRVTTTNHADDVRGKGLYKPFLSCRDLQMPVQCVKTTKSSHVRVQSRNSILTFIVSEWVNSIYGQPTTRGYSHLR